MGLLRVFLALSVVVSHGAALPMASMPAQTAVEIFFVISGFYMSLILRTKYAGHTGTFYLNRTLRLYPAYLFVLLLMFGWFAALWIYLGHPPANGNSQYESDMNIWQRGAILLSNLTMVGQDVLGLLHYKIGGGFSFMHAAPFDANGVYVGIAPDGAKWIGEFQWMGQAWSLGAEIWFYVLAPWLVRMRSSTLVAVAAASFVMRWWIFQGADSYFAYVLFPANLGFFLVGMLLERWTKIVALPHLLALSALLATIPYSLVCAWALPGTAWPHYLLIALIPSLFVLTKKSSLDVEVGNLSYPIYLCHTVVIAVLAKVHLDTAYAVIIVTLVLSAVIYQFVERPIDNFRQKLTAGAQARTTALMVASSLDGENLHDLETRLAARESR